VTSPRCQASSAEAELIDAGEDVLVVARAATVHDGPAAGARPATMITVRDGKVVTMRQFRDREKALAATG